MYPKDDIKTYNRKESAVFKKTKEKYGGLSNMANGFLIKINDAEIRTSEALYQACRFPHLPEVQKKIIDEKSPMTAKMRSKPHRKNSRPDWQTGKRMSDLICVKIMQWCLQVKLAQNWEEFSKLLKETKELSIVEESSKDTFWGAKPLKEDENHLEGQNVLGRLLMELRSKLRENPDKLRIVEPLNIKDFLLLDEPIPTITAMDEKLPEKKTKEVPKYDENGQTRMFS